MFVFVQKTNAHSKVIVSSDIERKTTRILNKSSEFTSEKQSRLSSKALLKNNQNIRKKCSNPALSTLCVTDC